MCMKLNIDVHDQTYLQHGIVKTTSYHEQLIRTSDVPNLIGRFHLHFIILLFPSSNPIPPVHRSPSTSPFAMLSESPAPSAFPSNRRNEYPAGISDGDTTINEPPRTLHQDLSTCQTNTCIYLVAAIRNSDARGQPKLASLQVILSRAMKINTMKQENLRAKKKLGMRFNDSLTWAVVNCVKFFCVPCATWKQQRDL